MRLDTKVGRLARSLARDFGQESFTYQQDIPARDIKDWPGPMTETSEIVEAVQGCGEAWRLSQVLLVFRRDEE